MSAARPDTWMPLYWGDYLRDTGHLSVAEHGAYLLLIGHYWTTGKPLPNNDAMLARIAKMTPREWTKAISAIAPFFRAVDGLWRHKRIDAELERWRALVEARAAAGRASAAARSQQTGNTCSTNGATNTPTKSNPSSSPSPSSDKSEDTSASDFKAWYAAFPKHVAPGAAIKAYRTALKKADAATLLAGAKRAAEFYRDTERRFIPHPQTWLAQDRWLDERNAEPVKVNGHGSEPWEKRLHDYRADLDAGKSRPFWNTMWGPPPSDPACHAPAEILERHGFGRKAA